MTAKVLLVVGMGPEIGMGMARRFGREGYRVGMISRNQESLDKFVAELAGEGIEAFGSAADVMDRPGLRAAVAAVRGHFGRIDVLEYSPLLNMFGLVGVLALDEANALEQFEFQVLGAITAVQAVLPEMIERGDGALLFTTGASAYMPAPSHANGSLSVTALRMYALSLSVALKAKGVYAGSVSIARKHDGDEIAENYWNMVQQRDRVETVLGDPRLFAAYEELVCLGLGEVFPPRFTGELPNPENERDRNLQLVSAFHVREWMVAAGDTAEALNPLTTLVQDLGGNTELPLYGGDLDAIYVHPPLR